MYRIHLLHSSSLRLLGLLFSFDLTQDDYIKSFAKAASMKVASLYHSCHYLTSECISHLYKFLIRPCTVYCCHIWAGAEVFSLMEKVQRHIVNIIGLTLTTNLHLFCFALTIMIVALASLLLWFHLRMAHL